MYYIKNGNTKYVLTNDGVDIGDGDRLKLKIVDNNYPFTEIQDIFSSIENEITVYTCIIQEDGRETDEQVSTVIPTFTVLKEITYDIVDHLYSIILISPDDIDLRLRTLEKQSSEKPPLTSPFTDNKEPTGMASRYYEVGELIAIYDKSDMPITVMVVTPISYGQHIDVDLNSKIYYGSL